MTQEDNVIWYSGVRKCGIDACLRVNSSRFGEIK